MSQALFPYETLTQPPVFQVTEVRVDGSSRPTLVNREESIVNLFDAKPGWRRVELDLELTAEREVIEEFEAGHSGLSAVAVANCMPTNTRQPVRLARSEFDPGRWEGTLELDRDNFRGRGVVSPVLTAQVGGISHRPVGAAAGWTLHFDEPEKLARSGHAARSVGEL